MDQHTKDFYRRANQDWFQRWINRQNKEQTTMTSNQEHINRLTEAQDLLREALDILKDVASETDNRMASAYITPHLAIMIDNEHDYLSRDYSVEDWIDELRDEDEPDDEEDYDDDVDYETPLYGEQLPIIAPPPTDPATFPHTPEFAQQLWQLYGSFNQRINAIKAYRMEYGVGLKEAKDAVYHIFDNQER